MLTYTHKLAKSICLLRSTFACSANTTEAPSSHTNVRREFALHRIIAVDTEDPRKEENEFAV